MLLFGDYCLFYVALVDGIGLSKVIIDFFSIVMHYSRSDEHDCRTVFVWGLFFLYGTNLFKFLEAKSYPNDIFLPS